MTDTEFDLATMRRALALAARGEGLVEPNPMVGAVIVRDRQVLAEGFHERFGGPHAEAAALASLGGAAPGATMYVTLEPCCHHGKTPPCSQAVIAAGVDRVVIAMRDPFPQVAGSGIAQLEQAGLRVEVGLCEAEARVLNAPYLMLVEQGRPWTIAKWAMTLDGKLATSSGDSRWISSAASRAIVHQLRGRVDAVVVGIGTALADDPLLTARPPGPRVATRVVLDSLGRLPVDSQLAQTAREAPVLVAVGPAAPDDRLTALAACGCDVWQAIATDPSERLGELWREFGRRRYTNVLIEGGSLVLGALFDAGLIDEVHAFVAPKLAGGGDAPTPISGRGILRMADALGLADPRMETQDGDVYLRGRIAR